MFTIHDVNENKVCFVTWIQYLFPGDIQTAPLQSPADDQRCSLSVGPTIETQMDHVSALKPSDQPAASSEACSIYLIMIQWLLKNVYHRLSFILFFINNYSVSFPPLCVPAHSGLTGML